MCQLHKSIHGLKQSPRAWHAQLSVVFEEISFERNNANSSLFVHLKAKEKLSVRIYVHDLIITGNNGEMISCLKTTLQHRFSIKYLDNIKYFLGIKIVVSYKRLFLNQHKYIIDLLQDAEMMDVKPEGPTPSNSKLKFETTSEPL